MPGAPASSFSIVTPSFRSAEWLRLCIASVADQEGVVVQHIVQDARSDDGTQDWLTNDRRVEAYVEADAGMYDAINRGFRRASGEIFAYLNCDEQYLPGALQKVAEAFNEPQVEVVIAGAIVVDENGRFICCRKGLVPGRHHIVVDHLPILSCSIFVRRNSFACCGDLFDSHLRAVADAVWVRRMLDESRRIAVVPYYTSVFTDRGDNLSLRPEGRRESRALRESAPAWAQRLRPLIVLNHRLRKLALGHYREGRLSYEIYTRQSPHQRRRFEVNRPSGIWRGRLVRVS